MWTALAYIASALIGAGTSLYAGRKQRQALGEAKEEAHALGERDRIDVLNQQRIQNALGKRQMRLGEEQFAFQRREAKQLRGERAEERTYGRLIDRRNMGIQLLNQDVGLRNQIIGALSARRA